MCDSTTVAPPAPAPVAIAPGTGSRRRRLWELPSHCHCPVIGACLPLATLRRITVKVGEVPPSDDDYDVHVGAVNESRRRGPLAEALQKELERRHALTIKRFGAAKTAEAVLAAWREQVARGDIAAALWAALTHPRCEPATLETIHHEVHMLQHQACALLQSDQSRSAALAEEHAGARAELERLRERYQQLQTQRTGELESLSAELLRLRTDAAAKDAALRQLREALDQAQRTTSTAASTAAAAADSDTGAAAALRERIAELTEANQALQERLAQARPEPFEPAAEADAVPAAGSFEGAAPPTLGSRAVLCVGGMHRSVAAYREIVEKHGGRFIHHDGGREDSVHRLDANLAAADLVICQAGCISHSAYWLVKDHCKRTGKRCVYLQKPSTSALARSLASMPQAAAQPVG
ncbi:MAG: DUF2325 domain-containing protein [Lautropia sp.]